MPQSNSAAVHKHRGYSVTDIPSRRLNSRSRGPAKRASSADSSGYDTDLPDEVQQEAVRRVCGALGLREQYDAAVAAGELLERAARELAGRVGRGLRPADAGLLPHGRVARAHSH